MRAAALIATLVATLPAASALAATGGAKRAPAPRRPTVKHAKVDDSNFAFAPGTLKIKRNTKVVWTWVDLGGVPHNIAVLHGPTKFRSGDKASGSFSHLFAKPGRYVLFCTIHPTMRETVVVK